MRSRPKCAARCDSTAWNRWPRSSTWRWFRAEPPWRPSEVGRPADRPERRSAGRFGRLTGGPCPADGKRRRRAQSMAGPAIIVCGRAGAEREGTEAAVRAAGLEAVAIDRLEDALDRLWRGDLLLLEASGESAAEMVRRLRADPRGASRPALVVATSFTGVDLGSGTDEAPA